MGIGEDLYRILPHIYRKYDHTPRTVTTDPSVPSGVLEEIEPIWTPVVENLSFVYPDEEQKFLLRFLRIFGDNLDTLWDSMQGLMTLQDADRCAYKYLELLANNLGMTLNWSYAEKFRRLFIKNIIWMYKHKGTNEGIIGAIKRITGYDAVIDEFNNHYGYWLLGVSELGIDTVLGIGGIRAWLLGESYLGIDTILGDGLSHYLDDKEYAALFTFVVYVFAHCDANTTKLIKDIVAYMKPAHTHYICPYVQTDINGDGVVDSDDRENQICCVYDLEPYIDYSDWMLGDDLTSYLGISTVLGTG